MESVNIKGHISKITESYSSILRISANHTFNIYDESILEKCITSIEHIFKAIYIMKFENKTDFDKEKGEIIRERIFNNYLKGSNFFSKSLNNTLGHLLVYKNILPVEYYNTYRSLNHDRNNVTHGKDKVSQEKIVEGLTTIKPIINWFFSQIDEFDWEEKYIGPSHSAFEIGLVERVISRLSENNHVENKNVETPKTSNGEIKQDATNNESKSEPKHPTGQTDSKSKIKTQLIQYTIRIFIGLLIISIGIAAYSFFKTTGNPKNELPELTSNPEPRGGPTGIDQTGTKVNTDTGRRGDVKQPDKSIVEIDKRINKMPDVNKGPEQPDVSKYINNTELKNKEGSNEMAVMIINFDNSINSGISQKVASVFLKNAGYSNTTSLLSRQFVTDGLFGRIFSGGGIDMSKYNFSEYTDYICLGKINMETEQSEMRNDMIKVSINLELMVVNATNGGEYAHLTVPVAYSTGAGFSKQQAIEVATENIVKYLKTYKHEN